MLAKERFNLRERDVSNATLIPFTAQTRMSGLDIDGTSVRKGAAESVKRWVVEQGGEVPDGLDPLVEGVATGGGTPLVVAEGTRDPRRHPPQGHRQGGHPPPLRPAPGRWASAP